MVTAIQIRVGARRILLFFIQLTNTYWVPTTHQVLAMQQCTRQRSPHPPGDYVPNRGERQRYYKKKKIQGPSQNQYKLEIKRNIYSVAENLSLRKSKT